MYLVYLFLIVNLKTEKWEGFDYSLLFTAYLPFRARLAFWACPDQGDYSGPLWVFFCLLNLNTRNHGKILRCSGSF